MVLDCVFHDVLCHLILDFNTMKTHERTKYREYLKQDQGLLEGDVIARSEPGCVQLKGTGSVGRIHGTCQSCFAVALEGDVLDGFAE